MCFPHNPVSRVKALAGGMALRSTTPQLSLHDLWFKGIYFLKV